MSSPAALVTPAAPPPPAGQVLGGRRIHQVGANIDPAIPEHVAAAHAQAQARGRIFDAPQDDMAKQRAEIAAMEQAKQDRSGVAGRELPRSAQSVGKVIEMGTAPVVPRTNVAGGKVQAEIAEQIGASAIRYEDDKVSKSQPHKRSTARDFRTALIVCARCKTNARIQQELPLSSDEWTNDAVTVLLGQPSTHLKILLPRKGGELIGFGGGGYGWYTDAQRKKLFCSATCLELLTLQMRQHGGKQAAAPVLRVNDASYAERYYESPAPAPARAPAGPVVQDVTTPAAPPMVSRPAAVAPRPAPAPAPAPVASAQTALDPYASPVAPPVAAPKGRVARDPNAPKPQRGGRRSTTAPKTTAAAEAPEADPTPES